MGFPLIASLAPLAAAGAIWLITGSLFALVFAALSPVVAVASLLDARRVSRRTRRRDAVAHGAAIEVLRRQIDERLALLTHAAWQRVPAARSILDTDDDALRWAPPGHSEVSLGVGILPSGLVIDGADDSGEDAALSARAATLTDAPVSADAAAGIGIVGAPALALALARALLVQLSFRLPPDRCGIDVGDGPGWGWAAGLPHVDARAPEVDIILREDGPSRSDQRRAKPPQGEQGRGTRRLVVAVAASVNQLPPGCATIVHIVGPDRAEILRSPAHRRAVPFRPDLVTAAEAARFTATLRQYAETTGFARVDADLPTAVAFHDLDTGPLGTGERSLDAVIGEGTAGAFSLDLVQNGPHAVVGGTTGSGKSELLVTWVAALARRYSPVQVTFLLVDFKGGAAFAPLIRLPHCVGVVTDLDETEYARALASLSAELRYRERVLRDSGARAVGDDRGTTALPRLVIVVDEFQAMLAALPGLHTLFVDIAARGRSLGVHLILCTQRPAAAARDALLANCSLRVSLRVNNRADSLAVIGTDEAAALSPLLPGRALIDRGNGGTERCQIAVTGPVDVEAIAERWPDSTSPRRPWLPPLPAVVSEETLAAVADQTGPDERLDERGSLRIGLVDEPDEQRYRIARYSPSADGHLLIVGAARSGKSSALALLAENARTAALRVDLVGAGVETTWDALERAHLRCVEGAAADPWLLLLDDFDAVYARWDPDYRVAALDRLSTVLRDGRASGVTLVVAVQRLSGSLQGLSALCGSTLLLRLQSRDEHVAAGGEPARFEAGVAPGGGQWRGARIQLLTPPDLHTEQQVEPPVARVPTDAPLVIVSAAPARSAERLRSIRSDPEVVVELARPLGDARGRLEVTGQPGDVAFVGDPDSWQVEWAALQVLRRHCRIVFDGCSLADFRLISRRRDLPPPLVPGGGRVWVLEPDGHVHRGLL